MGSDTLHAPTAEEGLANGLPPAAPPPLAATPARLPGSLRLALVGNAILRTASPAAGILLSTYYLPYINDRSYAVSAFTVGLLTAAFYATELTCAPLLGALGDRRGRRVLLIAGPLLGAAAIGLIGLTTALALLILARLLEGLSTAASVPSILGRLSEETDRDAALRGRVLSIFEVSTALGSLVGTATATLLWLRFGRFGFLVVAACYVLTALLFSRVRDHAGPAAPDAMPSGHSWRDSLRLIGRQRSLGWFLPAWLALSAITGLWFVHALYQMRVVRDGFSSQYLAGRFADDPAGLGFVILSFALTFSVGILLWGYLGLPRLHEVTVMRFGLLCMVGVCAALWVINHSDDNEPLRIAATIAYGILVLGESGFAPAAIAYLARMSGTIASDRGLLMGLYTVVSGGGYLLSALIGAPFAQRAAIDGVLLATVLLALGSQVLLWQIRCD